MRILAPRPAFIARTAAALLAAGALAAQAATAPTPAAVDPDKQKLVDHILSVLHPENSAMMAAQRPALEAMEKSRIALQQAHLSQDKIDKAMKDITVDVQKYVDTVMPLVKASAQKAIPSTIGAQLAQGMTKEELQQLSNWVDSPVRTKFDKLMPQLDTAMVKKVQEDVGAEVNKDIQVMTKAVGTKLRVAATAGN